ncbi:MAG: class I tRNA ligase family protein, partial [Chloroflexota bacterium]
GVDTPKTVFVDSATDLERGVEEIGFPAILKPVESLAFKQRFRRHVLEITDRRQLDAVYATVDDCGTLMYQEIIPGGDDELFTVGQYLDARAPWSAVKTDRDHAAETLYVALNVISGLVTMLHPVLPFSCAKAWTMLGHTGDVEAAGWQRTPVLPGTALPAPAPLFKKLDDAVVAEEEARLGS